MHRHRMRAGKPAPSSSLVASREADCHRPRQLSRYAVQGAGTAGRTDLLEETDLTTWWPDERFNLIFASGVLQCLPDRQGILTRRVSFLHDGGCLAVQVPNTVDEPSHRLMEQVASDGPWAGRLSAASAGKESFGTIDEYYACLQRTGCTFDLWETTYLHPLAGPGAIVRGVRGVGAAALPGNSSLTRKDRSS